MLSILIQKELKAILLSPKFAVTFGICALLLVLSVSIGVAEYKASVKQYETAKQLADQQLREQRSYRMIQTRAFRVPDPMQIFVSGLTYDIGRWAGVGQSTAPRLRSSAYSEDPIYAVFRVVDLAFIVAVVLSLLAVLFTYDAVCGEREAGTLTLVFSNSVPRAQYLLAKGIGAWIGLAAPVALALLVCLLIVVVNNVPMTITHWLQTAFLMGASLLLFTVFVVLGLCVSTLTRRSNVSFLISLVVWVTFVLIIPRAGVLAAGQMVSVPTVAEIQGQREAYAKDRWAAWHTQLDSLWETQDARPDTASESEMWARIERQDSMRKAVENDIAAYETRLFEDLSRRRAEQERLALTLSRFSPASAYQLAAMSLAATDLDMKRRYEDALADYRPQFVEYLGKKTEHTPAGMSISISSEKGFQFTSPREQTALDLSDMPTFVPPSPQLAEMLGDVVVDAGLLVGYALLAFAAAFVVFLRYDVR